MGGATHWAGGPGLYKKAGWASHGEQAHLQHYFMIPALLSMGSPDQHTVMDGDLHKCQPNKPFPSQVVFGHGVYHGNGQQTRTVTQLSL